LNAILAMNVEKSALYSHLRTVISEIKKDERHKETFLCCVRILDKLEEGKNVQQNTAQFMNLIIQDLLDFS
jgi:hypothetical protein